MDSTSTWSTKIMTGLDGLIWAEISRTNRRKSSIGENWLSRWSIDFQNSIALLIDHFLSLSLSLSLTTFMECFWRNGMSENCGRWLGIYKDGMPMRSGHTSDCVSARMLLVACAATHGRLHVVIHVSLSCTGTHPRPHVSQHAQISCVATHRSPACQLACADCRYGCTSCYGMSCLYALWHVVLR